jgi:hypothetical protein
MKKILFVLLLVLFAGCSKNTTEEPPAPVKPPVITVQPASQENVALGQEVTLTVVATGAKTCQWHKNGAAIPEATSATFTLKVAQLSDAGTFACTVSNEGGSVTSNVAAVSLDYYLSQGGSTKSALGEGKWRLRVSPLSNGEVEIEFYNPTTKQYFILGWKGGTSAGSKEPLEFISSLAEGDEKKVIPTSLEVVQFFGGLCYIKFNADNKVWEGVAPLS